MIKTYHHNYKGLPYIESVKQFLKDYKIKYILFGQFTRWRRKNKKSIRVGALTDRHVQNIVSLFGATQIRKDFPYVYYRYLLVEVKKIEQIKN